ncbi:MAG: translation initiation factor IF-2 subunit beta [Candidatus Nanoarchaeia archaeon]|nr:translation initiation factor IF-2 subunit beta [Candidatus Nanoarchaeia archaeon]
MDYEELLKKAKKELPETKTSGERFEIPKATGHVEGNKTIINNFSSICDILNRDSSYLIKYLQRELATPAVLDAGKRLVLGRKINSGMINEKIEQFTKTFVLCKECGKPDTKLIKEGPVWVLKCAACGAKHPVKSKI